MELVLHNTEAAIIQYVCILFSWVICVGKSSILKCESKSLQSQKTEGEIKNSFNFAVNIC